MNRCKLGWFFLCCALWIVGCGDRLGFAGLTPAPSQGGTGGTPSTTSPGGGSLLDGEPVSPSCCVQTAQPPLQGPSYFQFAAPAAMGPCPQPLIQGIDAYAEMTAEPHACGACTCSPAKCALPEGIHTSAAPCPGNGAFEVPFGPDPAAGWDGVCSGDASLPANLQCGGVACAQSLFVPALPVSECKPENSPPPPWPEPTWARMARECVQDPLPAGECAAGEACFAPPPEGLTLCLHATGQVLDCPPAYPARAVFFTGTLDQRACEACQCGPLEGAECLAVVSAFSDAACDLLAGAVVVTDQEGACVDLVTGTALGSAQATAVVDLPGTCAQSGGAPVGDLLPDGPLTLCCQGDPEPPG